MKNLFFILLIVALLCSCSTAVKIKSFTLKFTEKELYTTMEMLNDTSLKSGKITSDWVKRLKISCNKYNIGYDYNFLDDSTKFMLKLHFTDINYVNALLFDLDLKTSKGSEDFPLDLRIRNTKDSVYLNLLLASEIFYKSSYISIETPYGEPYFYPAFSKLYLKPEKVAPNKMDYYFIHDTNYVKYEIICKFMKNYISPVNADTMKAALLKKPIDSFRKTEPLVFKEDNTIKEDDTIKLFGFKQRYWEFWCIIIGGIASIIAIIAFFKKKY